MRKRIQNPLSRKSKYMHKKIKSARAFARKSFRTIRIGKRGKLLRVACKKGKFKKGRCSVGMQAQGLLTPKKYVGIGRAWKHAKRRTAANPKRPKARRKIARNSPSHQGWVSPNGKFFPLTKNKVLGLYGNHDHKASELLAKFYPKWRYEKDNDFTFSSGVVYATKALEYRGWVRVASDNQYSVWSINDPFTGRMRKNLADLIAGLHGGKVYVDTFKGDVIGGEYIDDILEKYQ